MNTVAARQIASIVRETCELEVRAFKPGNVSFASPGHGMVAEQFVASAAAMAGPLCRPRITVGQRIFDAVAATQAAAGCNTNLGIVLLLAPLVHAALAGGGPHALAGGGGDQLAGGGKDQLACAEGRAAADLRTAVRGVLAGLTVDDARRTYAAIRLAAPGGLGNSARHDVHDEPQVSLLAAMREASANDCIAGEYADGFAGIFGFGVPLAAAALGRCGSGPRAAEAATVAVYLGWMARQADTHVARKHGAPLAEAVRAEAAAVATACAGTPPGDAALPRLRAFDASLKRRGINPGTSADLTVASLVALRLQTALEPVVKDRSAFQADGHHPPRAPARAFHQPV